jgi:type I restriction enzyme R subunit
MRRHYPFLEFVLSQCVSEGVRGLDPEKLTPLLRLKYQNSIADAVADLGKADEIARLFAGFQKYLYVVAQVAQVSARVLRRG